MPPTFPNLYMRRNCTNVSLLCIRHPQRTPPATTHPLMGLGGQRWSLGIVWQSKERKLPYGFWSPMITS